MLQPKVGVWKRIFRANGGYCGGWFTWRIFSRVSTSHQLLSFTLHQTNIVTSCQIYLLLTLKLYTIFIVALNKRNHHYIHVWIFYVKNQNWTNIRGRLWEECNAEEWAAALIKVESWLQTPNQGRPPSDWGLLVEGSWCNAEQHEGWHTSKVTHWNKIPSQGKIHHQRPCLSYWHFKDYLQHLQREIVWWENTAFNPATPSVAVLLITSVKVPSPLLVRANQP